MLKNTCKRCNARATRVKDDDDDIVQKIAALLLFFFFFFFFFSARRRRPSVRPSVLSFRFSPTTRFLLSGCAPDHQTTRRKKADVQKMLFENFWKKRSFLFALVHLGSRSFFESLNVNSHIFASLFWDCFGKRQQQKKRRGRINLIADTANRHPKKPPSRELEKDGRRADSSADSKKELSFSARFFCCCCWTRFTGKKPFGRENCDRPLFRVRVRELHFLNRKRKA